MNRRHLSFWVASLLCAPAFSQVGPSDRLIAYSELFRTYPDGRMTLGFRLLNSLKRHLDRVELLNTRFKLTKDERAAVEVARAFFGSLDLSDLRTSVVIAQIDLTRSEIYVKSAKDVLASMDRPGGLSKETVQITARLVDAVVRRTALFDRDMAERDTLTSKFHVIRDGTVDPLVLSSALEVATSSFLEAVVQNQSQHEDLRRQDPSAYVLVARWLAAARTASAELRKQDLHGEKTLPATLSTPGFEYQPTPWIVGSIKRKEIENPTVLAEIAKQMNATSAPGIVLPGNIANGDFTSVLGEPKLASYEEAIQLKGKYFKGYRLDDTRSEARYVSLAGYPLLVSAPAAPAVGSKWQSVKMPITSTPYKFFSVGDFAASQSVSGSVALDTLFVLLNSQ